MALVEKTHFASKRSFSVGFTVGSTKPPARMVLNLGSAVAATVGFFQLIGSGHPIVAVWAASAILAWLFIGGASRAARSD